MKKLATVVIATALMGGLFAAAPAIASASTSSISTPASASGEIYIGTYETYDECSDVGKELVSGGFGYAWKCDISHQPDAVWDLFIYQ